MKKAQLLVKIAIAVLCIGATASRAAENSPSNRTFSGGFAEGNLLTARHFYLLQADALAKRVKGDDAAKRSAAITTIAGVNADTFVLDQYYADSPLETGLYSAAELNQIRGNTSPGQKALLCYFSVGEAENYRPYWVKEWDARNDGKVDAGAPAWLLSQNPMWKGNYRVRYWNTDWHAVLFGNDNAPLDRIIAQGFDGVYLDIIDGFETFEMSEDGKDFEENKLNPETGQTYRRDMVDFVKKIAAYARAKKPGFLIIPQNGSQLLDFDDYVQVISGVGQEDLYYFNNKLNKDFAPTVERLKKATVAGKAALVTDYSKAKKKQTDDILRAQADGFSIFLAPRALNGLGRLP
jgi:cysteinyl-tRNA synthetase, unknown class